MQEAEYHKNRISIDAILQYIKLNMNLNMAQLCELHKEDKTKLSRCKQIRIPEEYYHISSILEYQQQIIHLLTSHYFLTIEWEEENGKQIPNVVALDEKKDIFLICFEHPKQGVLYHGYVEFYADSQDFVLYLHEGETDFSPRKGVYQLNNHILSCYLPSDSDVPAYFCLKIGNIKLSRTLYLNGMYCGVTNENTPFATEILLCRTQNSLTAQKSIIEQDVPARIAHYFYSKRMDAIHQLIESLDDLPNKQAFEELSRVCGTYYSLRLSDDGKDILQTPVQIHPNGRTRVKGRDSQRVYESFAEVFSDDKLLAIRTTRYGNKPFHVLSVFPIGRFHANEVKWLNGVLAGFTRDTVLPRCSREIWIKAEFLFDNEPSRSIAIPKENEMPCPEYQLLNEKYEGVASYLSQKEDNLIVINNDFHLGFKPYKK